MYDQNGGKPSRERRRTFQKWLRYAGYKKNLPNVMLKNDWAASSPDLNMWSVVHETTNKDKAPKTLNELRRRLHFAWENVTNDTLTKSAHSLLRR